MNCSPDHPINLCAHCMQFLEYISGNATKLLTKCWWQHIPETWEVLSNLQTEVSIFITPIMVIRKWLTSQRYMHKAVLIIVALLPLSTVWALPTAIVMSHKDPTTTASSYVVSIRNHHNRWQALAMVLRFQILNRVSVTQFHSRVGFDCQKMSVLQDLGSSGVADEDSTLRVYDATHTLLYRQN